MAERRPGRPGRLEAAAERRRAELSRYSRTVRAMKIVLPLGAIALVVAIFLAGRENGTGESLLSAEDLAALAVGMQLDRPRFAGRTADGAPYVLRAQTAIPDGVSPERIRLDAPTGEITMPDGRRLTGQAEEGLLLRREDLLRLWDGVTIESSDGYRFESERLLLTFGERRAASPGPVVGTGPTGRIEAGNMTVLAGPEGGQAARIFFDRGVRVVFIPTPARDAEAPGPGGGKRAGKGSEEP